MTDDENEDETMDAALDEIGRAFPDSEIVETNPYEEAARHKKAHRLAWMLIKACRRAGTEEALDRDAVLNQPEDVRKSLARVADVNPPSETTWALVAEIVAEYVEARDAPLS